VKREEEQHVVDGVTQFLHGLVECQVTDPIVSSFLAYINSCSSAHNLLSPIDFPLDHPVEEVARWTLSSATNINTFANEN